MKSESLNCLDPSRQRRPVTGIKTNRNAKFSMQVNLDDLDEKCLWNRYDAD
jgi:hypothetical protein